MKAKRLLAMAMGLAIAITAIPPTTLFAEEDTKESVTSKLTPGMEESTPDISEIPEVITSGDTLKESVNKETEKNQVDTLPPNIDSTEVELQDPSQDAINSIQSEEKSTQSERNAGSRAVTSPMTITNSHKVKLNDGTEVVGIELDAGTSITGEIGQSAIKVKEGVHATIMVNGNVTLRGGNGSGATGAGAGVEVPDSSSVTIRPRTAGAKLTAYGGKASAATAGSNGKSSSTVPSTGGGGDGGRGGGAPGAGIGGKGGNGGGGGEGGPSRYPGNTHTNGSSGNSGAKGQDGGNCGLIYIYGEITVLAVRGDITPIATYARAAGGGGHAPTSGDDRGAWLGGGGGGAGGTPAASASIGGSSGGGGGGGGGGTGSSVFTNGTRRASGGSGGGGGGGPVESGHSFGALGGNGAGGAGGSSSYSGADGSYTSGGQGGAQGNGDGRGGAGGNGGSMGSPGGVDTAAGNQLYSSWNATIQYDNSNSSIPNSGVTSRYVRKDVIVLDECDITLSQDEYTYDGVNKLPEVTIIYKEGDRAGQTVDKSSYKVEYINNVNAGEKDGANPPTVRIKQPGALTSNLVKEPVDRNIDIPFTIHKKVDNIQLDSSRIELDYGESLTATISNLSLGNPGAITWDVLEGGAKISEPARGQAKIIPTEVGTLVIEASVEETQNYAGVSDKITIQVNHRDISTTTDIVIPNIDTQIYTGAPIEPEYLHGDKDKGITYMTNEDTDTNPLLDMRYLKEGRDFTYEYGTKNTHVTEGQAEVVIKAIGNYKGTVRKTFAINPRDVRDLEIDGVEDAVFTGKEIRKIPALYYNDPVKGTRNLISEICVDKTPVDNQENYLVEYKDAAGGGDLVNIGIKAVTIKGKDNLQGERTLNYDIGKRDINDANMIDPPDVFFDGREIESKPILSFTGLSLTEMDGIAEDTKENPHDYRLEYTNHELAGTATLKVIGINNFEGEKTVTFEVKKRPMYVLPDEGQKKLYGTDDTFGMGDALVPQYQTFMKPLNDIATTENSEVEKRIFDDGSSIRYPFTLIGDLGREPGNQLGIYDYTQNTLDFDELTNNPNNANYELVFIPGENKYNIIEFITDEEATLVAEMGKNDWYVETVQITAPDGFWISASDSLKPDNNWTDYITYPDEDYSETGVTYFLRRKSDKAISTTKTKYYKQDTLKPKGNIAIKEDMWSQLASKLTFNIFFNSDKIGEIFSRDSLSEVAKVHYLISPEFCTLQQLEAMPLEDEGETVSVDVEMPEGMGDAKWIKGEKFPLLIDELNEQRRTIYARIEDYAGNTLYISTDGIVFDKNKPYLQAEYPYDNIWTSETNPQVTGEIFDDNAGLKERFVAYQIDDKPVKILETFGAETPEDPGKFIIEHLEDGDYKLELTAWDNAENNAASILFRIKKDTVQPRLTVSGDTTTISYRQQIHFNPVLGASGEDKLEVRIDGGEWTEVAGGTSEKYYAVQNGRYEFRITNRVGLVSKPASITFTQIDSKPPKVVIEAEDEEEHDIADGGYSSKAINASFVNETANRGTSTYEYEVNGGGLQTVTGDLDNRALIPQFQTEGKYEIHVKVTSQAGLSDEASYIVSIDKGKPDGTVFIGQTDVTKQVLRFLTGGLFYRDTQEVYLEPEDPMSNGVASGVKTVDHFIYEGNGYESMSSYPVTSQEIERAGKRKWQSGERCFVDPSNSYIVYFRVTDHAGNVSYITSKEVVVDGVAPVITHNYERQGMWDANPVIDFLARDRFPGLQKVWYQINDQPEVTLYEFVSGDSIQEYGETLQNLLQNGDHTIKIYAQDLSGMESMVELRLKKDDGTPTITATLLPKEETDKDSRRIEIEAAYTGPSGLERILLQKNGEEWLDITDEIVGGVYVTNENGIHIFRAVTGAGATADAQVEVRDLTAHNVRPHIKATKADGTLYQAGSWTNQDVTLKFSGEIANLDGLEHYLKKEQNEFEQIFPLTGTHTELLHTDGEYYYAFKQSLVNGTSMSNPVDIRVKIDKVNPQASIKAGSHTWTSLLQTISFGIFFNKQEVVEIIASDDKSGVETIQYFAVEQDSEQKAINIIKRAKDVEEMVHENGGWKNGNKAVLDANKAAVVYGKVTDRAGNVMYLSTEGVVTDDISPAVTTDLNPNVWYTKDSQKVTFFAEDVLSGLKDANYHLGNGPEVLFTFSADEIFQMELSLFEEGTNVLSMTVKDKAGNEKIQEYTLKKDTVIPTVAAAVKNPVQSGQLVRDQILLLTATAGASQVKKVEVRTPSISGWEDITGTYNKGYTVTENGTYYFRCVNGAGVYSQAVPVVINNITSEYPIIEYTAQEGFQGTDYEEGTWTENPVYITFFNTAQAVVDLKYFVAKDDEAAQEIQATTDGVTQYASFIADEGEHTYTFYMTAQETIISDRHSIKTKVDTTAPIIEVTDLQDDWVKDKAGVRVKLTDEGSGVEGQAYSYDSGLSWVESERYDVTANRAVNIFAKDKVGNVASMQVFIERIDTEPPVVLKTRQRGIAPAEERMVSVSLEDYKDIQKNPGSGVKNAHIASTYPFENGRLKPYDNPLYTPMKQNENGDWVSEEPIKAKHAGDNDVWLVSEDKVGNVSVAVMIMTNMEVPEKPEPPKPDPEKPDPEKPEPEKPEPEKPEPEKPETDVPSKPSDVKQGESSVIESEFTTIRYRTISKVAMGPVITETDEEKSAKEAVSDSKAEDASEKIKGKSQAKGEIMDSEDLGLKQEDKRKGGSYIWWLPIIIMLILMVIQIIVKSTKKKVEEDEEDEEEQNKD